jgi:hypothetical protein
VFQVKGVLDKAQTSVCTPQQTFLHLHHQTPTTQPPPNLPPSTPPIPLTILLSRDTTTAVMPSPFWTHHNVDARTELPKRPLPEPLELEDGPHSPCSFMPRHSYSMMMSPAVHSRHSKINYGGGQILFPDRGGTWWSLGRALPRLTSA